MTNNEKIKCKYFDIIGDCIPQPVCRNAWIKEKSQSHSVFSDGFVPHCPFTSTETARVYCIKFESDTKYRITTGEFPISGPFETRENAQRFLDSLKIEEI